MHMRITASTKQFISIVRITLYVEKLTINVALSRILTILKWVGSLIESKLKRHSLLPSLIPTNEDGVLSRG